MDKTQPLPPPVLRKINWRELVQILKAPYQLGLPTPTNTDSELGWAVYSYMAPEILLNTCEGSQSLLLRIQGKCVNDKRLNLSPLVGSLCAKNLPSRWSHYVCEC